MIGMTPGNTDNCSGERPYFRHAPLQIGIGLLGAVQFLHDGEDDIGSPRREFQARGRAAGLDDNRVALG
jgi:hypothetical protein